MDTPQSDSPDELAALRRQVAELEAREMERRQAEEELKKQGVTDVRLAKGSLWESEERFRQIADAIDEVFWMTAPASARILYVSPAYERIWRRPIDDLYCDPQAWVTAIHPDDIGVVSTNREQQQRGIPTAEEFRILRPDGTTRWISNRSYPVFKGGQVYRVTGIAEDITERKLAEDRLKASLRDKEVLLRELHHRTKNTMQVIASMLALQADRTDNPEVWRLVEDTERRIQAMALVHQQLYQAADLSSIDLRSYIEELARRMIDVHPLQSLVALCLEIEPAPVLIDTAIPCGLVLSELLSNALKHAFPDGRWGTIGVRLARPEPGQLVLDFWDDGVGVPAGFDFRAGGGFGLSSIFSIAEHQMQGTVTFEPGPGVRFHMTFPDALYRVRV